MTEYIDRDKLIREGWSLQRTYQKDAATMVCEMKKPEDFPPADVRLVRRGRWIRINKYDKESNVKCPSCNEEFSYIDGVCYLVVGHELPLFCPNCGSYNGGDAE